MASLCTVSMRHVEFKWISLPTAYPLPNQHLNLLDISHPTPMIQIIAFILWRTDSPSSTLRLIPKIIIDTGNLNAEFLGGISIP
jgi:hypothetical protein